MEQSSFFNSVAGDRQYDMEEFALYFKQFLSTGVYHTDNIPSLPVSSFTGLNSKLGPGSAYIEGFMYKNTEDITFVHDAGDATNPRIDRIVIRLDRGLAKRSINAVVKKGIPATNPLPPALQRDDIVYEISIAQVRVNKSSSVINSIIDERLNEDVAGLVSSLITIPTEQFQTEWNAWFSRTEQYEDAWNAWFTNTEDFEAQWNTWFTGVQSGNPAMGGMRISVGSTIPTNPILNDIWIDTR